MSAMSSCKSFCMSKVLVFFGTCVSALIPSAHFPNNFFKIIFVGFFIRLVEGSQNVLDKLKSLSQKIN